MANPVNDVAYWKQQYDSAKQVGKGKDSLNWISAQAQKSYGQLDQTTANSLKGMNATQAMAYSKNQTQPTAGGSLAPSNEPFTMESFAKMLQTMNMPQQQHVGTDFSKLQFAGGADVQKNMLEMMQGIYQAELPYNHATVKDQLDYKVKNQDSMGYDDSGRMSITGMKLMGYDNEGNPIMEERKNQDQSKQDWAKMQDQSTQDWTKIFGYDAKGNLTFQARDAEAKAAAKALVDSDESARKWADTYGFDAQGNLTVSGQRATTDLMRAESDRWYKQEQASQGWANVDIRQQTVNNNFATDLADLTIKRDRLNQDLVIANGKQSSIDTRNGVKDQAVEIKALMNSALDVMKVNLKILETHKQGTPEGDQAFEEYQKAKMRYETAYATLDDTFKSGIVAGSAQASAQVAKDGQNAIATANGESTVEGISRVFGQDISGATTPGFNKPADDMAKSMKLTKTSALRTPAKNKEVGGSKTSDHLTGRASDYAGTPKQMEAYAQWAAKSGKYTKVIYGGRNLITGNPDKNHYDHVHLSW